MIFFLKLLGDEIQKWFDSIQISEYQGQIKLCVQFVPNDEYVEYIPSEHMHEMASIENDLAESSGKIYKSGPPPKPPQKTNNVSDDIGTEIQLKPLNENVQHLQQKASPMFNISNELNLLFQKRNKNNDSVLDKDSTFLYESNCDTELDSETESGTDNESVLDTETETENIFTKDDVAGKESQDENTSDSGHIGKKLDDKSSNNIDLDSVPSTPMLKHFKKPKPPKNRQTTKKEEFFGEEFDTLIHDIDLDSVPSTPTLTHFKKPTPPKNRHTGKKQECFGKEFESDFVYTIKKLDYKSRNDVDLDSVPSTPTLSHFKKPKPPKNRQTWKKVECFGEEFEVENKSDTGRDCSSNDVDLDSVPSTPILTQFKKPKPPKNRQTRKQYEISEEESDIQNISADKEFNDESGNEFGKSSSEEINEIAQSERNISEHLEILLKRRPKVEDLEKKGE